LSILWDRNIVHRDLKPRNIIIRPNKLPVIIDLGIARFLDLDSLTNTLNLMGPCTPIYAAPEQLSNRKQLINPRTDFFSLGIILLELLLGHHPFDPRVLKNGNSIVENIAADIFVSPKTSGTCSDPFNDLAIRLLKTNQYQRFRDYQIMQKFISDNWR